MKKEENIVRKRCRANAIFVMLMVLIILFSIPSTSSVYISSKIVKNDYLSTVICERITFPCNNHEHFLLHQERFVDNFKIRCYGQFDLFNLLGIILGAPVPFVSLVIIHDNNIPVTIEDHFTLIDTKHNRTLYDFNAGGLPWKLQPNWYFDTGIFTITQWIGAKYIFGPFDLIYKLHIPEDNSSTTVIFHGFVFGIGAKIFNSAGEKLE